MKTPIPVKVKVIQPPTKPVDLGPIIVTCPPTKPVDLGTISVTYRPDKPVDLGPIRVICPPTKPVDLGNIRVTVGDATKQDGATQKLMRDRAEKERIKNLKEYDPATEI